MRPGHWPGHRRALSLVAATALLASIVGTAVRPAQAQPVLAADTEHSGAGYGLGRNDMGQVNPASTATTQLTPSALPAGGGGALTDAVSVGAGNGFTVWADKTGKVWSLGDNSNGATGAGTTGGDVRTPVLASGFGGDGQPKAVKVTAYGLAVDILDDSGRVWQWGQVVNNNSTLAIQSVPALVPFPSGASRITDVSAGSSFTIAIDDAGHAYTWGKNDRGQLGTNTNNTSPYPVAVPVGGQGKLPAVPAGGTATIAAGRDFAAYALTYPASASSWTVDLYTWGANDVYQLGTGRTGDQKAPVKVGSWNGPTLNVLEMSGGATHGLLLLNDGLVREWGSDGVSTYPTPVQVPDPADALAGAHHPYTVAAGDSASFVASTDGTIAAWGLGTSGQLGNGSTAALSTPTSVMSGLARVTPSGIPVFLVSRQNQTLAISDLQVLRTPDQLGVGFGSAPLVPAPGQQLPSHTFVFTNVTNRPLAFSAVVLDGANPGDFTLGSSTCSGTLAVGSTCSVVVQFTPAATGARQAALILRTSNTRGGLALSTVVPLNGSGYRSVQGLTGYALALASGQSGTVSGPGNVIPLSNIPPSLIPGALPPTPGAPLGKLPLGKLPLGKLPLGKLPLGKLPLGKLPLGKLPLGKLPLGKLPLGKLPLGKLPLGKLPLGKLPLLSQGGWTTLLADYPALRTVPVDSLTLADLLDPTKNAPDPSVTNALPLDRVAFGNVSLAYSSLADVSALSVLAGSLRLDQYGGVDWCSQLPQLQNGGTCTDGAGLQRVLLELDLQGVPIETTTAAGVKVADLATDSASGSTAPFDETIFSVVTLASTQLTGTHVGAIPLPAIPNLSSIVDCAHADCTNISGVQLQDVPLLTTATYGDLQPALASQGITLGQLIEPFLDRSTFDWESMPTSLIPLQAYPNRLQLQADVDVNCLQVKGTTFGFSLPAGFAYVPGTATLQRTNGTGTVRLADPTTDTSRGLVVSVPDSSVGGSGPIACPNDSAHLAVRIGVLPTSTVGSGYKASGDVRTGTLSQAGPQSDSVTVTGVNLPADPGPDDPQVAHADELVLGTITKPGQRLYVPFDAAPDSLIEATLSGLTSDLDMVLSYPAGAPADPLLTGSTSAVQSAFGESAPTEATDTYTPRQAAGGALQDIPVLTDRPVAAIAAARGNDTEQLSAIARAGTTNRHVLQISGYNGATGPFVVRIRMTAQTPLGPCTTTVPAVGAAPTSAFYSPSTQPAVSAFGANDQTAVLVNTSVLTAYYGAAGAQKVLDAAWHFTHDPGGSPGQVLQVDASSAVQSAFAALAQSPCSPSLSNAYASSISSYLQSFSAPGLRYVVLAGDMKSLPYFFRYDGTRDGNERDQATEVALTGNNPLASGLAAGYPTDDPYGATRPVVAGGQVVYVPTLSVGRLGETPDAIAAQLTQFVSAGGRADPLGSARTSLVTDYDFLTSAGDAAQTALQGAGFPVTRLSSPTSTSHQWTLSELNSAWLGHSPVPEVAVLNMHYDQHRALPAQGNSTGSLDNLYKTSDVASAAAATPGLIALRTILSIGCHSALGVPDGYADSSTADRAQDFPETYANAGAAATIGNLGFGFADSSVLAYSAKVQALTLQGIAANYDIGTALLEAKKAYAQQLTSVGSYQVKSLQEMVLWGLPQYRFTSGPAAVPSAPASLTVPSGSTLASTTVSVGTDQAPLAFKSVSDPGGTTHVAAALTASGPYDAASVDGQPVLPQVTVPLPRAAGLTVRSAVPTSLTSAPEVAVSPTFGAPHTDRDIGRAPKPLGDFPAVLGHEMSVPDVTWGERGSLVVTPAKVHLDAAASKTSLRTYPSSTWQVGYGPAGTPQQDTISLVNAYYLGSGSSVTTTYDVEVKAFAGRTTTSAYVLAMPSSGSGAWVRTDLQKVGTLTDGTTQWSGGQLKSLGEYVVVSCNDQLYCAQSWSKGAGWQPMAAPTGGTAFSHLHFDTQPTGSNGWYVVSPTVTCDTGYAMIVDGVDQPCPYTFPNGAHLVQVKSPDGTLASGSMAVLVDTVTPTVSLAVDGAPPTYSADGGLHHLVLRSAVGFTETVSAGPSGYSVTDNGTTVGGARQVSTSTIGGPQSLAATITNGAGRTATATWGYRVVFATGTGFTTSATGVVVLPILPVRFSYKLLDANGNAGPGFTSGNTAAFSSATTCSSSGSTTLPSGTSPAASPTYNSSTGNYDWDLSASSLSGCQQLEIALPDGFTRIRMPVQVGPF